MLDRYFSLTTSGDISVVARDTGKTFVEIGPPSGDQRPYLLAAQPDEVGGGRSEAEARALQLLGQALALGGDRLAAARHPDRGAVGALERGGDRGLGR